MVAKNPQVELEKRVEKLEKLVDQLFAFLQQQSYVKKIGGEVLANYPVKE